MDDGARPLYEAPPPASADTAAAGKDPEAAEEGASWLSDWRPEDPEFWRENGARRAWLTLALTTAGLTLSFACWFLVSSLVVRLPQVGFRLTTSQLFWLTAMPGLAGGSLRILYTFFVPLFGTRHVVSLGVLSLLVPCAGWALVVGAPATPFSVLLVLAFLTGLGGANFSTFTPSTSLFFPRRLQGTALGLQAGLGNLGVSLMQFVTPLIIAAPLFPLLDGMGQVTRSGERLWLQNAALWPVPFALGVGGAAWLLLRSVPLRARPREQARVLRDKHAWVMLSLHVATFGAYSGFGATLPLLIRELYGGFPGPPDPLAYAFLGPLIGALTRIPSGYAADRVGGARLTMVSTGGILACLLGVAALTPPGAPGTFPAFLGLMLALFFFSGIGNASTVRQIPQCFAPGQAGNVIGWAAAAGAYGPFLFSVLLAAALQRTGSPDPFLYGFALFVAANLALNWWLYARPGAETPC